MGGYVEELERLYLNGKEQAEQFKVLFDDIVPSRVYEDRARLADIEERVESAPPAHLNTHSPSRQLSWLKARRIIDFNRK
jgi:hypothetical protein